VNICHRVGCKNNRAEIKPAGVPQSVAGCLGETPLVQSTLERELAACKAQLALEKAARTTEYRAAEAVKKAREKLLTSCQELNEAALNDCVRQGDRAEKAETALAEAQAQVAALSETLSLDGRLLTTALAERDALHGGQGMKHVLDACCGSRMFWFNRIDPRCVFVDKRSESHQLTDSSSKGGTRSLIIAPDIQADFTELPFESETFSLVVFDPPHLVRNGKKSWLAKKYGKLEGDWRGELTAGFSECFRVLRSGGTLVFKWNENDVPVSQILVLTPERPLFGNRCGKSAKSHWIVFLKP
jgi:SAM-dependent methyltransferase